MVSFTRMLGIQGVCLTSETKQYSPTHWSKKFQISTSTVPCYKYRVQKNSMRWEGGPQRRFTVKQLSVGDASVQCRGPSKWNWLRLEIKQNHWSILKKSCISYQFQADVQTKLHRESTTMQSGIDDSQVPGCCQLNNMGSKILFRINWRESLGFNVAPL